MGSSANSDRTMDTSVRKYYYCRNAFSISFCFQRISKQWRLCKRSPLNLSIDRHEVWGECKKIALWFYLVCCIPIVNGRFSLSWMVPLFFFTHHLRDRLYQTVPLKQIVPWIHHWTSLSYRIYIFHIHHLLHVLWLYIIIIMWYYRSILPDRLLLIGYLNVAVEMCTYC